jgi:hypothetical protein
MIAITLVAFAVTYLGWRYLKQRRASTCCGEDVCPAMKQTVDRLGG